MDTEQLQDYLLGLLDGEEQDYLIPDDMTPPQAMSFSDAGIMTTGKGLVISTGGSEFQIQIIRSR